MNPLMRVVTAAAIAGGALLSGCASLNTIGSDVTSYGTWPVERTPGTYSFDRLPSQQKNPQRQDQLEAAAAYALGTAGFRPAPDGEKGDVTVQIGARINRYEVSPWADPFWGTGFYYYGYYPGWWRPYGPWPYYGYYGPRPWCCGWGWGGYWYPGPYYYDYYDREVAILIRNGADGVPLYESRATSTGSSSGSERVIAAMFEAAMKDFPHSNDQSHSISIEMQPKQ
jgi:hypothetical protein